jgi:two-component system nitrogen regulation sensor histidine kinase GlnL
VSEVIQRPGPAAQIDGLIFALLLIDTDMVIRQANPAAEDLLQRSAKRLIGQRLLDVIELEDHRIVNSLSQPDKQLTARGLTVHSSEKARVVNMTISPLQSHAGWRVITLSNFGQSDLVIGDESGLALRAPAILAHEIKNPLAAIRGAAQLLARRLDEKDRPLGTMITDEVDRIARLIDRMQRLGSKPTEQLEPCNLHEAIRQAITTVQVAGGPAIPVFEEFDPSLPPVMAHHDALEQVLINLLSNARDACAGADQPAITVKTRFVSGLVLSAIRLGRAVKLPIEITITDNGPGIDPALRDHVFEPFVTSKKSGQGLGLALVKKLLRDMDGRIAHERDERAGLTHFRINLSVAK